MRLSLSSLCLLAACSQARVQPDLSVPLDMTPAPGDMALDMRRAGDMSVGPDMAVPGDMAQPLDMTMPGDLATEFNVTAAVPGSNTTVEILFDGPVDGTTGAMLGNYDIPGLTLSGTPVVASNHVTLTTSGQDGSTMYTVTVSNVTRTDGRPLTNNTAMFLGRPSFNVVSAVSTSTTTFDVTFDAPPDSAATTLLNYGVGGLSLLGTPVLSGSTVTIKTSGQAAMSYMVTVSNVKRGVDGEALTANTANFSGTPVLAPTVTNVVVTSTSPNNGTTPYNTGTITATITGTDFASVSCPAGVTLDDLDGAGAAVSTAPTSCNVDSDTQITATFPAGIRSNGTTGWNVRVTNSVGTNATSTVKLVVLAGIVISEVYVGNSGAATSEFVEIYNQTGQAIDITSTGINLRLRIRNGGGTESGKTLTKTGSGSGTIPAHGFLLFSSTASAGPSDMGPGDPWVSHADFTYSAGLVAGGSVAITLSTTVNVKVIDKVGWGAQPSPGYEGTAFTPDISSNNSIQRKVTGHVMTDADNNSTDFSAQSTSITPQGTADPVLP